MVVSFDILTVLAVIELLVFVVYLVLLFAWKDKNWSKITRLIAVSVLTIINVAQLPMIIIEGKSYRSTIDMIIFWFIHSIFLALRVVNEN